MEMLEWQTVWALRAEEQERAMKDNR